MCVSAWQVWLLQSNSQICHNSGVLQFSAHVCDSQEIITPFEWDQNLHLNGSEGNFFMELRLHNRCIDNYQTPLNETNEKLLIWL